MKDLELTLSSAREDLQRRAGLERDFEDVLDVWNGLLRLKWFGLTLDTNSSARATRCFLPNTGMGDFLTDSSFDLFLSDEQCCSSDLHLERDTSNPTRKGIGYCNRTKMETARYVERIWRFALDV